MDTREVAAEFTRLCKNNQPEEAGKRFWADNVVSIEAMEGPMARAEGLKAVQGKSAWWYANHEIHSFVTEGPYVNGKQFALEFRIDVTAKAGEMAGKRMQMKEVGVYTVENGKVVEERFFY